MQMPPPFGPPQQAYRSNAPPPPFAPSREAMEAERLAKEARDRRQANDDLVIGIYRVIGVLAVSVGILLFCLNLRTGAVIAWKIIFRTVILGGVGGGFFARGNTLAKRREQIHVIAEVPVMHTLAQPPFIPQPQSRQMPPPEQPGQITRWTD